MQLSSLNVSGLANSTQHLYQTSNMLLLKRLTRMRYHLVHNLTREKNRALNLIYLKFSTFSQECPFSDIFGKASCAIIENFTPDDIASMPQERFN